MKKIEMKYKKIFLILLGIIIVFLDQITKYTLMGKNLTIIPNILNFTYTENTGVAFGIGANNIFLTIIVNIIVLGVIIDCIRKNQTDFKILIPLILIFSGGVGNLIDRIFRGYVIDFIDINLFNFPNFNIADICITIGIIFLIIIILNLTKNDTKNKNFSQNVHKIDFFWYNLKENKKRK